MKAKYDTDFFILDKFPLAVRMLILAKYLLHSDYDAHLHIIQQFE